MYNMNKTTQHSIIIELQCICIENLSPQMQIHVTKFCESEFWSFTFFFFFGRSDLEDNL